MTEEKRRELLEGIREDANWLLNMVENLLSVTRIRDGRYAREHIAGAFGGSSGRGSAALPETTASD